MHFGLLSVTTLTVMAGVVSASTLISRQGPPCTVTSGTITTTVQSPSQPPTTVAAAYNGDDPCAPDGTVCTPGTTSPASGSGGFTIPPLDDPTEITFTFSGTTIVGVSKDLE